MNDEGSIPVDGLKPVLAVCPQCRGSFTNHRVIFRFLQPQSDFGEGWSHTDISDMILCLGCESVKMRYFREEPCASDEYEYASGDTRYTEMKVYPSIERPKKLRQPSVPGLKENKEKLIPSDVYKMYAETLTAIDANCRTLAGAGLRSIVEAVCNHRGIIKGSLEDKIEKLDDDGLLGLVDNIIR